MWLLLRNTDKRGRSAVPEIFLRMRSLRLARPLADFDMLCSLLPGLAGLLPDLLAHVADALTVVGLRRTLAADMRGELAHELLAGGLEVHARVLDARFVTLRSVTVTVSGILMIG